MAKMIIVTPEGEELSFEVSSLMAAEKEVALPHDALIRVESEGGLRVTKGFLEWFKENFSYVLEDVKPLE